MPVSGVVCDIDWALYGGAEGLSRALRAEHQDEFLERPYAPESELGDDFWGRLHPLEQFLIGCGISWRILRWVPRTVRVKVALGLKLRTMPEGTQPATSPTLWRDEVRSRIACSHDFHQRRSRETCYSVAEVFTWDLKRTGRPLVWLTQEMAGEAIGKSTKTVQRSLHWLQQQELLVEVVPGMQLDRMYLPEDPTPEEREQARGRIEGRVAAAEQAEAAAMARARTAAELRSQGYGRRQAVAEAARRHPVPELPAEDESVTKINVAPVYELRVPIPPEVLAEQSALREAQARAQGPGIGILQANRDRVIDLRNALAIGHGVTVVGRNGALVWLTPGELWEAMSLWAHTDPTGLTSANVVGFLRGSENVHPPLGFPVDLYRSPADCPVDKRPASPGFWTEVFGPVAQRRPEPSVRRRRAPEGSARVSRARRAAQELRELLDPALAEVSVSFLKALIEPWLRAGWSTQSILRRIHGQGVPAIVRTAHGYLKKRLLQVPAGLSPDQRADIEARVAEIDQENADASKHRVDTLARAKRRQIDNCALCDEVGWVEVEAAVVVRCSHDPETGGW